MVKKRNLVIFGIVVFLFVLITASAYLIDYKSFFSDSLPREKSFEIDKVLIRESIPVSGEASSIVVVKNLKNTEQVFKIYPYNLEGQVFLNITEITIPAQKWANIPVFLRDKNHRIDIYSGHLVIEGEDEKKKVPVILGVESRNPFFAVLTDPVPNYEKVFVGGKLGVEVKIFNLKDYDKHEVRIRYLLKNFDGNIISSDEETRIVKDSIAITKFVNIPEGIKEGKYVLMIFLENEVNGISSYFFDVSKVPSKKFFERAEFFAVIILVFIVGMFWLLFHFFRTRDEIFLKLQKQQNLELKNNLGMINEFKKEVEYIDDKNLRKKKLLQLKREREKVILSIKKKQENQKREIKDLGKQKKKKKMLEKLNQWKKQGYEMPELQKKIRSVPKQSMKSKIKKWMKQGYNLNFSSR